jgi:hypothetical protein
VTEVLGMIESVPYQEFIWRIEPHELRGIPQMLGDVLVQERAHLE